MPTPGADALLRAEALLRDARGIVASVAGEGYGDTPLAAPAEAFVEVWGEALSGVADLVGRTGRWRAEEPT